VDLDKEWARTARAAQGTPPDSPSSAQGSPAAGKTLGSGGRGADREDQAKAGVGGAGTWKDSLGTVAAGKGSVLVGKAGADKPGEAKKGKGTDLAALMAARKKKMEEDDDEGYYF
jgi:hypothetical protein